MTVLIFIPCDSTLVNEQGIFILKYTDKDYGMGYLSVADNKQLFLVLGGESVKLKGKSFAIAESIKIIEGYENQVFEQYATEHPLREQALSAWGYLVLARKRQFLRYSRPEKQSCTLVHS
ncbi:MAG: hypothetical protein A2491_20730 [Bacteroidetes bacterium RIFOXYC12_FULL_35_7]|nr:MAG: hypothetical protein A2491_20730 [Bacteroidetes bacterium RIFOXYC12_FULL_35_7]